MEVLHLLYLHLVTRVNTEKTGVYHRPPGFMQWKGLLTSGQKQIMIKYQTDPN